MSENFIGSIPPNMKELIYNAIVNNTNESIYFKDLNSKFVLLSQYHLSYFGLENMEQALGKSDFDFFTKPHAQQAYYDEQEIIQTGKPILGKIEQETWEGDMISYVVTSKYPLYDENNNIIGTWGHSINIASTNNHSDQLKQKIIHLEDTSTELSDDTQLDHLTQLNNVKSFYNLMNLFYQKAMNSMSMPDIEHILILIDMNNFKSINDNFGHVYGDQALVYIADILKAFRSEKVKVFRYGGDEFAFLIENTSYEDAVSLCKQILHEFKTNSFVTQNESISLTASLGMSRFRESLPFGNIHDIINIADKRLRAAKESSTPTLIHDNSYYYK